MADESAPSGLTAEVARDWVALGRPAPAGPAFRATADVGGLPEPVRRWLQHAIADGTPAVRGAELTMHGEIRLGRWAPFTAVQRLSVADGFVWAATARPLGLPVLGFDRWTRGTGEMRWRLLDTVPVMSAAGEDVTRSAAGRLAGELLVALPTAALAPEVTWRSHDGHSAVAVVRAADAQHEVTLTVGHDGSLTELVLQRWGPLGHGSYGAQPFGVTLHGELTVGGITVPRRITAGWHYGTDRWAAGQFIRWTVDDVRWF
ncbi:MAG TPA: DUF6544 family protein [Blastococcus sp.]|jgi:hypothetical protein|nr:DUF6544 family protein [Blastococcus sp.]